MNKSPQHIKESNLINGYSTSVLTLTIRMRKVFYLIMIMATLIVACKKPYNPTVIATSPNYLVVEGVINNGTDTTVIHLSRTVKLAASGVPKAEAKATVTVEDDQNTSYALKEIVNGNYVAVLSLNNARNYRLRIKTTDGLVYVSDYEAVKNAPPIDSITYKITDKGLTINANTHDAANNTRYYRWGFEEAWQFKTFYRSDYITTGKDIVQRTPAQNVEYCFTGDTSTSVLLGTTDKLSDDVEIMPVTAIASTSEKVELRYSILVKEYALTKDAYAFWDNIRKNNETLGSIFDAQPSAPIGNIHCITNPAQPVIGYISVGTVTTKRIFIDHSQLPAWGATYPYSCLIDSNYYYSPRDTSIHQVNLFLLPLTSKSRIISYYINLNLYFSTTPPIFSPDMPPVPPLLRPDGYLSTSAACADCTIRGKVSPPPFWK